MALIRQFVFKEVNSYYTCTKYTYNNYCTKEIKCFVKLCQWIEQNSVKKKKKNQHKTVECQ